MSDCFWSATSVALGSSDACTVPAPPTALVKVMRFPDKASVSMDEPSVVYAEEFQLIFIPPILPLWQYF